MSSIFDYATALTATKENLYTSEAIFIKEYNAFMLNRILSNSAHTVLFADALNCYPHLDPKIQHDFYLYGIPKKKIGKMWTKKEESVDLERCKLISEALQISMKKALEISDLISDEVLDEHRKKIGGKN
jgi:hypothetical protein